MQTEAREAINMDEGGVSVCPPKASGDSPISITQLGSFAVNLSVSGSYCHDEIKSTTLFQCLT